MSQPPPPRYKIVERDGRLVTVDTWMKVGAKNGAPSVLPRPTSATAMPGMTRPPGLPERLVAALLRVQDAQGRRLLTTGPNWDRKGPRTIALSPVGERRLGTVLLVGGVVLLAAFAMVVTDLDLLLPFGIIGAVLFGSAAKSGVPLLTRFVDSLGEDVRD